MVVSSAFVVPPPRSINKFLITPSRWSLPKLSQLKTRVVSNLLYFQTNYLLFNLVCFIPFVILSMKTVVVGLISAVVILVSVLFFKEYIPQARQIKQNHPGLVVVGGILLFIMGWRSLHTILWMAVALAAPTPVWFLHAAARSSDKLLDIGDRIQYNQTPIGRLMRLAMIEPKMGNRE